MAHFEIKLGDSWRENLAYLNKISPRRPADKNIDLSAIRDIIDIVIDGQNVTSYVQEEKLFDFFHILTKDLVGLLAGNKLKSIIEFPSQPWELAILPEDESFLISVYSIDRKNRIATHNKPVDYEAFTRGIIETAETLLRALYQTSDNFSSRKEVRDFSNKLAKLKDLSRDSLPSHSSVRESEQIGLQHGSLSQERGLTLQYWLDGDARGLTDYCGEHKFDLHALLAPGEIEFEYDQTSISLDYNYPLLFVESTLVQLRELLNVLESEKMPDKTTSLEQSGVELQPIAESKWKIIVRDGENQIELSSRVDGIFDFLLSALQTILRDFLEMNPKLELNHRFSDIAESTEELEKWRTEQTSSNMYNRQPESYIEDLGHWEPIHRPDHSVPSFPNALASTDHLFPRYLWEKDYDNIGFQSIRPTTEGLVVPSRQGIFVHNWDDGRVKWSRRDDRSFSFSTFGSKLLIARDKEGLELVDLSENKSVLQQRQLSVSSWSHLVDAAEYPEHNLLIAVGARGRILGLDTETGQKKWRFGAKHGRFAGVAFSGPLVTALSAEGFLYALNPKNGELIWKIRLGGLTEHAPVFHEGRLYVFSRDAVTQKSTIHAFFPFTGREAWRVRFNSRIVGPVSFADRWALIPGERAGQLILQGIDLEATQTGVEWQLPLASAGIDPPSKVVEVTLESQPHGIIKTDRHELTCLELNSGTPRWNVQLEEKQAFLHQNVPIIRIRDAILAAGDRLQLRSIETGECFHELSYPVQTPVFLSASGELKVTVGEMGSSDQSDRLIVFELNHFLTEI